MSSLEHHVSTILAKSAKAAADEIIKLFDSSFEAFIEELRQRQQEIDRLRRKLELAETELISPGQAYFCGQCGVSLSSMSLLEQHHTVHHSENAAQQHLGNSLNEERNETLEAYEEETECFEFETLAEESPCYSQLIFGIENTEETPVKQEEKPSNNAERAPGEQHQKRGRGRPRKPKIEVHVKRPRGRPRKTEETGSIEMSLSSKDLKNKMKRKQLILENVNQVEMKEISTNDIVTSCEKTMENQNFGDSNEPETLLLEPNSHTNKPNPVTPNSEPQTAISTIRTEERKPSNEEVRDILRMEPSKKGRGRPKKSITRKFCKLDYKTEPTQEVKDKPDGQIKSNSQINVDSMGDETFVPFGEAKSKLNMQENLTLVPKKEPENSQEKSIDTSRVQNGKGWTCPKCPRVFKSKVKLQTHQKIHLKKGEISCRTCGMTFVGRIQMENHEKVHTGEKPFSCSFCPKRFRVLSHLKKHMLNHTTPTYSCTMCAVGSSTVCSDETRRTHLRGRVPCSNCANGNT